MKIVHKIEPIAPSLPTLKRVAAYCRVSSGKEAMLKSLSAQISSYSAYIQNHRGWEYAGVYVDEAVTGTKENRDEFQRLLGDCRNGKIDLIITKSISRFARNTVITLEVVRELKCLGVEVWFERENIWSLSGDGELMLTILSSFAQEESRSASENQKWRVRKNFKEGRPTSTTMLGYKLIDGTFYIVPEEAEIIRMIFSDYLSGMGVTAILKKLTSMGLATKRGGEWRESAIHGMLRNEKYAGELLLQKTFTADHITKKQCMNNGELPKYHVSNAHEAIIDTATFALVQAEIARRAAWHKTQLQPKVVYPFTSKIICGQCGKHYRRKITNAGSKYEKPVWICTTFNRLGKVACPSQQIPEDILTDLVDKEFTEIQVLCPGVVVIVLPDGSTIEKQWENPSRSESWTEEMKQAARQKRLERSGE